MQNGAYVEVEGELRYRANTPGDPIAAFVGPKRMLNPILALDRADKQSARVAVDSNAADEPLD